MLKKKKFLIGGVILFLALSSLVYTGFMSSATYYYEVDELLAQGNSIYGENVRVHGWVASDSVEQEAQGTIIKFTLIDIEETKNLPVAHKGVVPDTFKVGAEIVAEGYLDSDGTFQSHTILAKCASKYEQAD